MKVKRTDYIFNATNRTITFSNTITLDQLLLITNVTRNIVVYNFADNLLGASLTGNVLTLSYNTSSMSSTDVLQIFVEESDATSLVNSTVPAKVQMAGFKDTDGNSQYGKLTENDAVATGNAMRKFRDGFITGSPDLTVWDQIWTNQSDSFVARGGDTAGSSYLKISLSPLTPNSEYELISKDKFKLPSRFIAALSMSQRIVGQEVEVSLVGCDNAGLIEVGSTIANLAILGTITITSNVATINFASPHNLHGGDRVVIKGNEEKRLNVGPVVVTIVSSLSITVPCTLANGTYNAGGFVEWADQVKRADNAAGVLFENTTATNASWFARRNGASIRSINSTVASTVATQSNTSPYSDAFNAASHLELQVTMQEMLLVPRPADSVGASGASLKYTQGIPDEEKYYKLRLRAKSLSNLTRPVARIVSITKTGTTTANVVTNVPHGFVGLPTVQIYGVRDQTNFPNLTAQTNIASIVSPTEFTIVIGAAVTATSAGGGVWLNEGSVLAPGVFAQVAQSISRTNNVLTLVGNGTWATPLPGETVSIYGCDATSMGLYDGAYKVLRVNATLLELASTGLDFVSINCGGAVIRRTDVRVHFVHEMEYTRHIVEIANQHGSLDASRSIASSIVNTPNIGSITTLPALAAGTNLIGLTPSPIPTIVADVASAAITSSNTVAAITPSFGLSYELVIPVTAVSGTNPTYDISIEESDDSGTSWYRVYDLPRITTTGVYRTPKLSLSGNRVRYVQTIGGTSPSFTRSINRLQTSDSTSRFLQFIDRSINLSTLNSTTPVYYIEGCTNFNFVLSVSAQTTAVTLGVQFSTDGSTWHNHDGGNMTSVVGIVHYKVANEIWRFVRLIVLTAGTGITINTVEIRAK